MATLRVTAGQVRGRARSGGTPPVMRGANAEGLTSITTSGTSQIVQRAASDWEAGADTEFVRLWCDGNVWIHIDAAPVAVADIDHYLPSGAWLELSVASGDKIAVKDA